MPRPAVGPGCLFTPPREGVTAVGIADAARSNVSLHTPP